MTSRLAMTISLIALGGMLAASAWILHQLPSDTRVAIHFDINGQPNGFAGPLVAFLTLPGLAAALTVLFALLPRFEPRAANLARSIKAYETGWIAAILLLAGCHALLIAQALGRMPDVPRVVSALLGVTLILTGNVAAKARSNFTFGIRTPWTLADERVWRKTHRLYGWASVGLGFLLAGLSLGDAPPIVMAIAVLAGLAMLMAASVAYSYWVWRRLNLAAP
jgi:uncharacterized membrane protein